MEFEENHTEKAENRIDDEKRREIARAIVIFVEKCYNFVKDHFKTKSKEKEAKKDGTKKNQKSKEKEETSEAGVEMFEAGMNLVNVVQQSLEETNED